MDDLTQVQAEGLKKISTERIRSRLIIKIGYDEDLIFATERSDLLTMMAECMIKPEVTDPSLDESADIRAKELHLREQELKLHEAELLEQAAAREMQQKQYEIQQKQHAEEMELRKAELRMTEQRNDELEFRRAETKRSDIRDEQNAARECSLAAQTKKFGDILKHVLPRMPADPGELMTFWDTVENLWSVCEVPENLRAKLILPMLTPKAKSLVSRLSVDELSDIKKLEEFLLREFRLTSRIEHGLIQQHEIRMSVTRFL